MNQYLIYLNNEKDHDKMEQYKSRFSAINKLGLLQFGQDTTVFPKESEHFQEYNQSGQIVPFEETKLYTEDRIGLKTLDQ